MLPAPPHSLKKTSQAHWEAQFPRMQSFLRQQVHPVSLPFSGWWLNPKISPAKRTWTWNHKQRSLAFTIPVHTLLPLSVEEPRPLFRPWLWKTGISANKIEFWSHGPFRTVLTEQYGVHIDPCRNKGIRAKVQMQHNTKFTIQKYIYIFFFKQNGTKTTVQQIRKHKLADTPLQGTTLHHQPYTGPGWCFCHIVSRHAPLTSSGSPSSLFLRESLVSRCESSSCSRSPMTYWGGGLVSLSSGGLDHQVDGLGQFMTEKLFWVCPVELCLMVRHVVTSQVQWPHFAMLARIFCKVALNRSTWPSDCGWKGVVWIFSTPSSLHTFWKTSDEISTLVTVNGVRSPIPAYPIYSQQLRWLGNF